MASCVRWELSWAGGRDFYRGVCRIMLSMKSCRYLAAHALASRLSLNLAREIPLVARFSLDLGTE